MEHQNMKTIKIGIINCSNATQEMDCCSVSCLRDFNKRLGSFQHYQEADSLRLVGMISCAGCPTKFYPDKILKRVDSLIQFGVTHVHFSNCMTAFCPFLKTYSRTIKQKYPDIELINGTHEMHISNEEFRDKVSCALKENKKMPDVILGKI